MSELGWKPKHHDLLDSDVAALWNSAEGMMQDAKALVLSSERECPFRFIEADDGPERRYCWLDSESEDDTCMIDRDRLPCSTLEHLASAGYLSPEEHAKRVVKMAEKMEVRHKAGIAEAVKAEREGIHKWGLEECFHWRHYDVPVFRKDCSQCWKELEG